MSRSAGGPVAARRAYFVRNPVTAGSRPPLFFAHGDFDGGGLYCLRLASHLGADQPLVALHPHGLDGGPLPPTIEAMAASLLEIVRALAPSGPYRLAGHCNGGLVAYEMARGLVRAGERVERLILIAARADHRHLARRRGGAWRLAYYRERVARWHGLPAGERRVEVRRWLGRRLPPWTRRILSLPAPERGEAARRRWWESPRLHAYRRVMARYVPDPYPGPVTLLWPVDERRRPGEDGTLGWQRVAPAIRVLTIPGHHASCLREHAPALAATLRACLDGAQPR